MNADELKTILSGSGRVSLTEQVELLAHGVIAWNKLIDNFSKKLSVGQLDKTDTNALLKTLVDMKSHFESLTPYIDRAISAIEE